MRKILSILLTLAMVLTLGTMTVFAAQVDTLTGNLNLNGTHITGTLTGSSYTLAIDANINGTGTPNWATFAGTATLNSSTDTSNLAGKINYNGYDTMFATFTVGSDTYYLTSTDIGQADGSGNFPVTAELIFVGAGETVAPVTDIVVTAANGTQTESTGFSGVVGETLQFDVTSPAGYTIYWAIYANDRTYASIDQNGTLHLTSMPANGNILIMANTLDPNVYSENIMITVADQGSVVTANADVAYTVVIPASVNFGTIYRTMSEQNKDFTVAVVDAQVETGSSILVTNTTTDMTMKDQNGTGTVTLPFTLAQTDGTFTFAAADMTDGTDSITSSVSCNPANLTAAGSYKGYMTFSVTYNEPDS